ncbi:hypothetical protein FPRO04_11758 [Fusarium proliferatum]|nr:hypothetical protein FPRO04_11758 [Fusarium proliferatum]
MPVPSSDSESPYLEFVQAPEGRIEDEDPPYIPMTMTDQNGSVLCETENFDLLRKIICRDDVTTLKKYLAIAPLVIEEVDELPCYYSFFYIAVSSGSLGALKVLLDQYSTVVTMQYPPAGHTHLPVSEKKIPPYIMHFFNLMGKT